MAPAASLGEHWVHQSQPRDPRRRNLQRRARCQSYNQVSGRVISNRSRLTARCRRVLVELVEQCGLFDVDEQGRRRGLQVPDLLGREPGRPVDVELLAGCGVVDAVDVKEQRLGIGMRAEPGEGLDEASVKGVGGLAEDEAGERVAQPVAARSLRAQSAQCDRFRMDPDRAVARQLERLAPCLVGDARLLSGGARLDPANTS
jgi:hypothetical protein